MSQITTYTISSSLPRYDQSTVLNYCFHSYRANVPSTNRSTCKVLTGFLQAVAYTFPLQKQQLERTALKCHNKSLTIISVFASYTQHTLTRIHSVGSIAKHIGATRHHFTSSYPCLPPPMVVKPRVNSPVEVRLIHTLLLSTGQEVEVAAERRVPEVELPRGQELTHVYHQLHGGLGTERYEGGLGELEDLRVLDLPHRLAPGHQHQVLHHGVVVVQSQDP